MRPWLLRPACVGRDSTRVFSGSSVVISSKPEIAMKRRPGLVGLNFLIGMVFFYTLPNKPSIFWPSPSVTMAFFQAEVWPTGPMRRRLRLVLPRMLTVLTSLTRMPWASYCSSTDLRLPVLVAARAPLNVYRPCVYGLFLRQVRTGPMPVCEAPRVLVEAPGLHARRDRPV